MEFFQRGLFETENFDDDTVKAIRTECACEPELGKGKKIKDIYEKELLLFLCKKNHSDITQSMVLLFFGIYQENVWLYIQ